MFKNAGDFVPPCVTLAGSANLAKMVRDMRERLESKGRELEGHKRQKRINSSEFGPRDTVYLLALLAFNRYIPLLDHLIDAQVHPWSVYGIFRQIIGELSSFSERFNAAGEPVEGVPHVLKYDHRNMGECFSKASSVISQLMYEITAGPDYLISLEDDGTYYSAKLEPEHLADGNRYYLVMETRADLKRIKETADSTIKAGSIPALALWIAFMVTCTGMLGSSYVKNLNLIRETRNWLAKPPEVTGRLLTDLNSMERLRRTILEVEERNRSRWYLNMGLTQGGRVEDKLKKLYGETFRNNFIARFDQKMADTVFGFSRKTPDKTLGEYVPHLTRRINILQTRLEEGPDAELMMLPPPDDKCLIAPETDSILPKTRVLFKTQYFHYLAWTEDEILAAKAKSLKEKLDYIAAKERIGLDWLIPWCDDESAVAPVTLNDFWGGGRIPESARYSCRLHTLSGARGRSTGSSTNWKTPCPTRS